MDCFAGVVSCRPRWKQSRASILRLSLLFCFDIIVHDDNLHLRIL